MANEYYRYVNNRLYHANRDCPKLKEEAKTNYALLVYKSKSPKYTPCECVK